VWILTLTFFSQILSVEAAVRGGTDILSDHATPSIVREKGDGRVCGVTPPSIS